MRHSARSTQAEFGCDHHDVVIMRPAEDVTGKDSRLETLYRCSEKFVLFSSQLGLASIGLLKLLIVSVIKYAQV